MEEQIKTTARVKVLLEISLPDLWGSDCLLSQVHKQAEDSAMNIISQKIVGSRENIRIIGKPESMAIIIKE